jgi:hypothetical protein
MFKPNKYTRIYFSLIHKAKGRLQGEKHHIIPRALGGKSIEHNVVWLTPREHYMAHRILLKAVDDKHKSKLVFGLSQFLNGTKYSRANYRPLLRALMGEERKGKGRDPEAVKLSAETRRGSKYKHSPAFLAKQLQKLSAVPRPGSQANVVNFEFDNGIVRTWKD